MTPVEYIDGYYFKRDDKYNVCGVKGGKARIGRLLAVGGRNDLVMGEYDPKSYNHWMSMLERCYGGRVQGAYKDCSVCEEWMVFSGFNKWFNEQQYKCQEEYHLDKDILIKGNKVYSPETCCLVPPEINVSLTRRPKNNRDLPIGVYHSKNNKRFFAVIDVNRKQVRLGTFDTIEEAFLAYKKARESQIKTLADKYKDLIDPHVYEALYNYKIEITD